MSISDTVLATPQGSSGSERDADGPVAAPRFEPGQLLAERYRIISLLQRGGMGAIYLAEHLKIGQKVAVKVVLPEKCLLPTVLQRFREEARRASAVRHPNIVQIYDADELPDGSCYLVMEYVDGRELSRVMAGVQQLAVTRALLLIREIADAIRAAHEVGVIHRDLKPANVMVTEQGRREHVKVLDFGIAAKRTTTLDESPRTTDPGAIVGTAEYMAPEQAQAAPPSPALDIYSLGVILHELLTGARPFEDADPFALIRRKLREPAPTLANRRPDLPREIITLVDDCLALEPERRPRSAEEFLARVDSVLGSLETDRPVTTLVAAPPSRRDEPSTGAPTSALRIAAASAVFVLALAGAALYSLSGEREDAAGGGGTDGSSTRVDTRPPASSEGASAVETSALTTASSLHSELAGADTDGSSAAADVTSEAGESDAGEVDEPPAKPVGDGAARPSPRAPSKTKKAKRSLRPEDEECARTRASAEFARESYKWRSLLDAAKRDECWTSRAIPRKLRVKALMELKRFDDCARVGSKSADPEVQRWVKLCASRREGA